MDRFLADHKHCRRYARATSAEWVLGRQPRGLQFYAHR
jgi:hypothetical protein